METENSSSQNPGPRPQSGVPPRPINRRPMVDGFAPRRAASSLVTSMSGMRPGATRIPISGDTDTPSLSRPSSSVVRPAPSPARPEQNPIPRPFTTRHVENVSKPESPSISSEASMEIPQAPETDLRVDTESTSKAKPAKEPSSTGRAGLIGLVVFVLLGALLLSPLIPGKTFDSFPLASNGSSTGNQSLDCLGTQGTVSSTTKYNTKTGAPITYTYSSSTTQSATCDGQMQSVVAAHASQFNPLGLVIDIITALVVAVIVSTVWRLIFSMKQRKSR